MKTKTLFLCGHTGSSEHLGVNGPFPDFITDDEARAKAHVQQYTGSWDKSGFYYPLPFYSKDPNQKEP